MHINHPQALTLLIHASEQGKRCHDRMTKAFVRFPHAALAALAELLAQKDEKRWRMMLMTMLISQPILAEQVIPLALDTRSCRTEIMPATTETALKPCQRRYAASHISLTAPGFRKRKNL